MSGPNICNVGDLVAKQQKRPQEMKQEDNLEKD